LLPQKIKNTSYGKIDHLTNLKPFVLFDKNCWNQWDRQWS